MNNIIFESEIDYKARFSNYYRLMNFTYSDAVKYLRNKYGPVTDNYFSEKSYNRFLGGEIKSITRGKFSRSVEGLYTHHILENKYPNISNEKYINFFRYSYDVQLKTNLIYTDLVEHLILHALISKETSGEFGFRGYETIQSMVSEWYVGRPKPIMIKNGDDIKFDLEFENFFPKPPRMQLAYRKAFLKKEDAKKILTEINEKMISPFWNKMSESEKNNILFPRNEMGMKKTYYPKNYGKELPENNPEIRYPNLIKKGINLGISRQAVLKLLYKYSGSKLKFSAFKTSKLSIIIDDLFDELEKLIAQKN